MQNILLTSTGFSHASVYNHAKQLVQLRVQGRAAIVTTASSKKEKNEWAMLAKEQLTSFGVQGVQFIDFENDPLVDLTQFNILYVNGGNTFRLLKSFQNKHTKENIQKFLKGGGLYIGVSAGSSVLGLDIQALGDIGMDENNIKLLNTSGYGILPFSIVPHFVDEFIGKLREQNYYPLKDGHAIWADLNGNYEEIS